ncbi:translation initiation factor eIF 4e-like domain-containing protein [Leucosporidium creatinivorum]|uniref:Translation initiation factor eIF 4e-like domain-containing protein n=1 Tax=Leucosporidium creatinivorum TaxID=106004 RepID=A0A1Y2G062_9BASI|nr:translation initiation factor eIF 4e-like domain-containing protein [Leucosporidium creatinivorum]
MPSAPRYPLEHRWTFYQQSPREVVANKKPAFQSHDRPAYESSLTELGEATSVESFARLFNPLKTPSKQEIGTSLYIFKDGIIPAWEHEANANGGKWSLLVKGDAALLDRSWLWLVLALVGEKLVEEAEICGAGAPAPPFPSSFATQLTCSFVTVLSIRPRDNRIQLWCRDKSRISQLNTLGRHVLNILELFFSTKGLHFEFFPHNAGSSSPSPVCFSINNPARPAKTTVELRRGSSFDGATSGLGALPEGVEGGLRIPKPSPLGFTVNSGSGWRKPAVELNEASVQAPSGGESDGRSTAGSTSRPTASTSRSAWW